MFKEVNMGVETKSTLKVEGVEDTTGLRRPSLVALNANVLTARAGKHRIEHLQSPVLYVDSIMGISNQDCKTTWNSLQDPWRKSSDEFDPELNFKDELAPSSLQTRRRNSQEDFVAQKKNEKYIMAMEQKGEIPMPRNHPGFWRKLMSEDESYDDGNGKIDDDISFNYKSSVSLSQLDTNLQASQDSRRNRRSSSLSTDLSSPERAKRSKRKAWKRRSSSRGRSETPSESIPAQIQAPQFSTVHQGEEQFFVIKANSIEEAIHILQSKSSTALHDQQSEKNLEAIDEENSHETPNEFYPNLNGNSREQDHKHLIQYASYLFETKVRKLTTEFAECLATLSTGDDSQSSTRPSSS
jgi:hypothetical protein